MTPPHYVDPAELFETRARAIVAEELERLGLADLIERRACEIAREEVGLFARSLLDRLAPEPSLQGANYRIISKALEAYEERGDR
jgi:hypothetical protein